MRAVIAEDSVWLRADLIEVLEIGGFQVAAEDGDGACWRQWRSTGPNLP